MCRNEIVQRFCGQTMSLKDGRLYKHGSPADVVILPCRTSSSGLNLIFSSQMVIFSAIGQASVHAQVTAHIDREGQNNKPMIYQLLLKD